jgi:EAL domain-containing protein (putative c-di-GMP-specific phosphodiesterase class I)
LIVPLGEWILKHAISLKLIWEKHGINLERISIKISSVELRKEDFLEKVENVIIASGIAPKNIEFEITEGVLMDDLDKNIQKLEKLRELGARVALDDFGTGYSSFNYLRILPIDVIKIDKSFIDGICKDKVQRTIVESIITMSHKMGIEVIAEGVEDVDQLKILTEFECDIIQGYVFSKPLLAEDLQNYYLKEKH